MPQIKKIVFIYKRLFTVLFKNHKKTLEVKQYFTIFGINSPINKK